MEPMPIQHLAKVERLVIMPARVCLLEEAPGFSKLGGCVFKGSQQIYHEGKMSKTREIKMLIDRVDETLMVLALPSMTWSYYAMN